jgi:hypothetical protein
MSGVSVDANFFTLSKNPSNSDKTRIADSLLCNGSPSIPSNSSDKSAPDAQVAAPRPAPHLLASLYVASFRPFLATCVHPQNITNVRLRTIEKLSFRCWYSGR